MTNQQLAVCIQLYRRLLARCILELESKTTATVIVNVLTKENVDTWPEFEPLWDLVRLMDDDTDTLEGGAEEANGEPVSTFPLFLSEYIIADSARLAAMAWLVVLGRDAIEDGIGSPKWRVAVGEVLEELETSEWKTHLR